MSRIKFNLICAEQTFSSAVCALFVFRAKQDTHNVNSHKTNHLSKSCLTQSPNNFV